VALLKAQYQHFIADSTGHALLEQQLDCLTALHGNEKINDWKAMAAKAQWDDFVAQMLFQHYDPAYDKSIGKNFKLYPNASTLNTSALSMEGIQLLTKQLIGLPS
jgi:tRNA 2-selenouridine synthase